MVKLVKGKKSGTKKNKGGLGFGNLTNSIINNRWTDAGKIENMLTDLKNRGYKLAPVWGQSGLFNKPMNSIKINENVAQILRTELSKYTKEQQNPSHPTANPTAISLKQIENVTTTSDISQPIKQTPGFSLSGFRGGKRRTRRRKGKKTRKSNKKSRKSRRR
jgi:hypothetical protein